jgi:hypothetical protein
LTAFAPIAPLRAVKYLEAAGLPDGRLLITDYAAAGLLKSYALRLETVQPSGEQDDKRGAAVPLLYGSGSSARVLPIRSGPAEQSG